MSTTTTALTKRTSGDRVTRSSSSELTTTTTTVAAAAVAAATATVAAHSSRKGFATALDPLPEFLSGIVLCLHFGDALRCSVRGERLRRAAVACGAAVGATIDDATTHVVTDLPTTASLRAAK